MNELIAFLDTLDLPAPIWRTAVRLAHRAGAHLSVTLSHEDLRAIVGTDSDNTARAHLIKLHRVGVLWFKRNSVISVTFCRDMLITVRSNRASSDQFDRTVISTDGGGRASSDQIDRPAINLIAQRSPDENPVYITTTTTNVVVDDDHDRLSSSSSSSTPKPPTTLQPEPQPQPPARYAELQALYENNIGMITPIMAGTLKAALVAYPFDWIEAAIELAVRSGVHRWNYVEGILSNWRIEGRNANRKANQRMATASGNAGRRTQPDRRTAETGGTQQQQWGPEWYFDPDEEPAIDEVA